MVVQKLKQKAQILSKVLKFVYTKYTAPAILRDVLFVLATFAEIYGITILGRFIDETTKILIQWDSFDIYQYLGTDSFLYLSIILILWIIAQICRQAREYLFHIIFENIWEDTQHMVISKVSASNLEDIEKEEYQDMLTFVPAFSLSRVSAAYENFSFILSNFIRLISSGIILFGTMGWSVLLLLIFVLPETIATHTRRKRIREYQDREVGKIKYLNYIQNIALTISSFTELRVNDTYSYLKRKYREEYDEYIGGYLDKQANFTQDKTLFSLIGQTLKFGYIIYVLAYSITKRLTFGTFKALYDYVDVIYTSIFHIIDTLSILSNNLGYIDEFFNLVEYEGFGDYSHGEKKLAENTPRLQIKQLNFQYPDDPETKILKDIDMEIEPGEKVAFFGGDGSGKSTMVKILTGLYRVQDGEYMLDGNCIQELDRGQLKKKYSVTFQDFINYNFSLMENVVISGQRKHVDTKRYEKVCRIAGVNDFKKSIHLEDGSILGKTFPSGKDLSPGYWQRLAIARMLYRNKNIFLMDEPFTFIDDISAKNILSGIFEYIGKKRTLIYITRSVDNLDMFDRIYFFEKGKIVESGSWRELMRRRGKFFKETKMVV